MNDIVIVSYECDELGNYFELCNKDIQTYINYKKYVMTPHCQHNSCTRDELHNKIDGLSDDYIVTIYAHGEDSRIKNNEKEDLINLDDAEKYYNNAIVYSAACNSANVLGKTMHSYNCKLFFGHTKKSYVVLMYKDTFIELENFALKEILDQPEFDAHELCQKIDNFFDIKIIEMKETNPLVAPLIMHNKESYKIYKNRQEYPA